MNSARMSTSSSANIADGSTQAQIIEVDFGRKRRTVRGASSTQNNNNSSKTQTNKGTFAGTNESDNSYRVHHSPLTTSVVDLDGDKNASTRRENDSECSDLDGVADNEGSSASSRSNYSRRGGERGLTRSSSYVQHTELVQDIHDDIVAFFSKSALSTYMSRWAKAFLLVAALSVVFTFIFGGILLTEVYDRTLVLHVDDGSVCTGSAYEAPQTSTLWYNIALIFLANVFMVWYALRGMALEKWGTSVCYVLAALTAVGRVLYTVAGGLLEAYKVPEAIRRACVGGLLTGAVIALLSLALLYKALREFGWRNYVKGATTPAQVYQMNKYQILDLFLKFDVMLCVHTIVSIFFAVDSAAMITVSGVVIAATVLMLVLMSYFIKKQITWFVYAFVALCPAMPVLYIYLIISQSISETSRCQAGSLSPCLYEGANITVGLANYSDPHLSERSLSPAGGRDSSGDWFILHDGCFVSGRNSIANNDSQCLNTSKAVINSCCSEYGRCQYTKEFFKTDQVLLIMLAVAGVVVRVLTVVTTYKRMKEMDSPIIRELFERGQRNLRSFALIFVRQGSSSGATKARSASRVGDTDDLDSSSHPNSRLDAVLMHDA